MVHFQGHLVIFRTDLCRMFLMFSDVAIIFQ